MYANHYGDGYEDNPTFAVPVMLDTTIVSPVVQHLSSSPAGSSQIATARCLTIFFPFPNLINPIT